MRFYPCTSPLQESSYSHLMSETLAWLRKSEHEVGVGGSPELPTQSCLLSLTSVSCQTTPATWPPPPPPLLHMVMDIHSAAQCQHEAAQKYFPCVLSSFGVLLILHVISMTLQVTLRINSTPNTPKCKRLKSVRNEVIKG